MTDNKRNHLIDLLRFLSALWVAFYHFNQPIGYINNWYRNFLKLGYLGVPVFFVISGYCVILSAYHSKNWKDFLIRRLFRIFPPYLFSLLITLIAIIISKMMTGYNSMAVLPKNLSDILITLTLFTYPFSQVGPINWVYWSLTCELIFYIIVCLSLVLPSNIRLLFLLIISLFALFVPVVLAGPLFFLKSWPVFALGFCIYFIQAKKNRVLTLLLIIINCAALVNNFLLTYQIPYFITTIAAILLISISIKFKLRNNIFSKAGDYSYSVYLLHVPIGIYVLGFLKKTAIQQNIGYNMVYDILTYAIVFIAAYFTFRFIESPSINLGKRIQKANFKSIVQ